MLIIKRKPYQLLHILESLLYSLKYIPQYIKQFKNCNKFIASALLIMSISKCSEPTSDQKVFSYLKKAAESASKSCPVQVDSILRLENVTAFVPATLRYNYSLLFDTTLYDLNDFKEKLRKNTLNTVKTSPGAKTFHSLLTTFEYNYSDTTGNFLFRFIISPEEYWESINSEK